MDNVLQRLATNAQHQVFGKHRGVVVDNQDPEHRGRLKLQVPSVLGSQTSNWALPCLPFGGLDGQGCYSIPEVDAQVWVEFEAGNIDQAIWVGTFWQPGTSPGNAPPEKRLFATPSGHVMEFDDSSGEESFRLTHPAGTELTVTPQGSVNWTDASGAVLHLDAQNNRVELNDASGNRITMDSSGTVIQDSNGNSTEMAAAGITIKGTTIKIEGQQVAIGGSGGEALIKAQTFLSLFNSHTHACTAPGSPSGPPIPPLTPAVMTLKTTAS
ncbi:phage baseplate assembly protein V [Marinobacterium sedimentorum]|uniref:phage baseplate assembly protein V n=1 Tax=Marinobacterium sedimentorum TaxID=2927804 RepID=UPI0020C6EE6A|nr:phage baseplate assembly protein V [Marinobacterium sedimentorum]MCP8689056.1 phage baseplate assembly protein V [Marinobacterium sedimentorum]